MHDWRCKCNLKSPPRHRLLNIHIKMPTKPTTTLTLLFLLLIATHYHQFTEGEAKRRIHVTDDLDDVVDDEEDDAWREWGKKKTQNPKYDLRPDDFSKLSVSEMQSEMLKHQFGPVFGFVKLRLLASPHSPDMVSEIAMKWTNVARTGGIEAKFMGVDVSTIMFTMERGQDTIELKEFILSQPDAYEVKIGDQLFRRSGDPPFEEVFEKFQSEKRRVAYGSDREGDNKQDEL